MILKMILDCEKGNKSSGKLIYLGSNRRNIAWEDGNLSIGNKEKGWQKH